MSVPFSPVPSLFSLLIFTNFPPLPSLVSQRDTAVLALGMEMRCLVALCQGAADWTLAWMVQQMFADFFFFLFKWTQNIGSGAKSAGGTLQWTPAPLTPHDVFMCWSVIAWIITSTALQGLRMWLGGRRWFVSLAFLCQLFLHGVCFPQSKVFHFQSNNESQPEQREGRPAWHETELFMGYVAVTGVWLITGSQDVGGFRWYFITLASPFLIKSRPTLSPCWVTSSICICICVSVYRVYTVYVCLHNTTWYYWLGPHAPSSPRTSMRVGDTRSPEVLLSQSSAKLQGR